MVFPLVLEFYCDQAMFSLGIVLNELYSQLFKAPEGGATVRGVRGLAGARSAAAQKRSLSCLI